MSFINNDNKKYGLPEWFPTQFDNPITMAIESVDINGNIDVVYIEDADSVTGREVRHEHSMDVYRHGGLLIDVRVYFLN